MKILTTFLAILISTLLVACGSSSSSSAMQAMDPQTSDHDGNYQIVTTLLFGSCATRTVINITIANGTAKSAQGTFPQIDAAFIGDDFSGTITYEQGTIAIFAGEISQRQILGDWEFTDQSCSGIFEGNLVN